VEAAAAALGGEDAAALGTLAGFDLALGENAAPGAFEPDRDAGGCRRVDQRRRGGARRRELLATDETVRITVCEAGTLV
jgi:hypothetical protein